MFQLMYIQHVSTYTEHSQDQNMQALSAPPLPPLSFSGYLKRVLTLTIITVCLMHCRIFQKLFHAMRHNRQLYEKNRHLITVFSKDATNSIRYRQCEKISLLTLFLQILK